MARIHSTAALVILGLSAAACTAGGDRPRSVSNPTLNSVNQPVVHRTDYVIDLGRDGRGVAEAERYRLAQWFDSLQLGYGDRISVDTGRYDDPAARDDVAAVAAEYGLLLTEGRPVTAGAVPAEAVRVIVRRSVASVPGCPNWDDALEVGARISTSPNYGCSLNSNIAAMVADPNDLVLGQVGGNRGDLIAGSKAIKSYRTSPPSGAGGALKTESSKGGN